MSEAIIITLVIVGGLVSLAWIALHFGYKAWSAQRADKVLAEVESRFVPYAQPGSLDMNIHAPAGVDAAVIKRAAENHLAYAARR